jgi:hypothetical protein
MAEVFSSSPKLVAWNEMLPRIANITLTQEPDEFCWNLLCSGQFSVKSHYMALIYSNVPNLNRRLWNLKVSHKLRFCFGIYEEGSYLLRTIWPM